MAENSKDGEKIEEIKEIFQFLTEKEPTPDEEIEAREKLIEKFSDIKSSDQYTHQVNSIEDILDLLEKWDTLDLWFKEVEPLVNRIENFLRSVTEDKEIGKTIIKQLVDDTSKQEVSPPKSVSSDVNITQIINQVTDQFKGEITKLKDTINYLKKELESNGESLKEKEDIDKAEALVEEKSVEEPEDVRELEKQTGTQTVPEKPSLKLEEEIMNQIAKLKSFKKTHIKPIDLETIEELDEEEMDIPDSQSEYQELALNDVTPTSIEPAPFTQLEETPEESANVELESEPVVPEHPPDVSVKNFVKLTPEPQNFGGMHPPEESYQEVSEDLSYLVPPQEQRYEEKPRDFVSKPHVLPKEEMIKQLKKIPHIKEMSATKAIPDKPVKEPTFEEVEEIVEDALSEHIEVPDEIQEAKDEPQVASIISEILEIKPDVPQKPSFIPRETKTEKSIKPPSDFVPFVTKMPKITQVKVVESESETKKADSKELFNVFSKLGEKEEKQPEVELDPLNVLIERSKEKKLREEPPKALTTTTLFNTYQQKPLRSERFNVADTKKPETDIVEELPQDKDLLYQELIALEGKRYSLEKSQKELELRYKKGSISDVDYKSQLSNLRTELDYTTSRINKIRRITSRL